MKEQKILVIGSGLIGLTSALKLAQAGHKVTVWSKEPVGTFPRTSLNAWATWWPVSIPADPRVEAWNEATLPVYTALANEANTGVTMKQIFSLQHEMTKPWYDGKYGFFRYADASEIAPQYAGAFVMDKAPVIDPNLFLPWLHRQVCAQGVEFAKRVVNDIYEISEDFDVVVNCTGLAARELANDPTVFAARLQVLRIRHNGFDKAFFDDSGPTAVVPHGDHIRIGATYDEGNESLAVDESGIPDILERVRAMLPGFQVDESDIMSVTRVLRPERKDWLIRVEKDELSDGRLLIHNYGHDGMGYGTSFGIAEEVASYLN